MSGNRGHLVVVALVMCVVMVNLPVADLFAEVSAPSLFLAASAGTATNTTSVSFMYTGSVKTNLGISYAFESGYGPLPFVSGNSLFISAQLLRASYCSDRATLRFGNGTARMTTTATALFLDMEIRGPQRLSPFIRAGLGAAHVDFAENYSADYMHDVALEYWGFAYAYGAGLHYVITPRLGISLTYEGICVPGRHTEPEGSGVPTGIFSYWGDEWLLVRFHVGL